MSFSPVLEVATYTNTDDSAGNGDEYELLWSTDSGNTQKYDLAINGAPLLYDTSLNINWESSGSSYFELTTYTGLTTGATGATILSNGTLNIDLSSGDKRGYIRFTVNNSGVTSAGFIINVNNAPDPVQAMGTTGDTSDNRYILKNLNFVNPPNPTDYGYTELSPTGTTIFMVSVL